MSDIASDEKIKSAVRETYGGIARRFVADPTRAASCCSTVGAVTNKEIPVQSTSCCGPTEAPDAPGAAVQAASCCDPAEGTVESGNAAARLYPVGELDELPDSVTGAVLGCGNPTAIADLQPGEVVLDLGSGGGIDCFLAAKKVGSEGRVIGLDMTPEMIRLARQNAKKVGVNNVDFRYGEMEDIPLQDASVDVVISNCVINLSPDKDAVFGEAFRVLRPGGRMSISDIVIEGELPPPIRIRLDAWAGCLAGALDERVYLDKMRTAGFERVEVVSRDFVTISQVAEWEEIKLLLQEGGLSAPDLDRKVASIKVTAFKST